MTRVVVTSTLAPVMREPSPRAELVSQMVMGETGIATETQDAWQQVTREFDGYAGWVHRGYLSSESFASDRWLARATYRADAAVLEDQQGYRIQLPLLARLATSGHEWELASGWCGRLVSGSVHSEPSFCESARAVRVVDWARHRFAGSAYLWGGITPWGSDCSGMVQTSYAVRGVNLPRDSRDQALLGDPVNPDAIEPGDLLFFSESGTRITHVAIAGDDDTLVHSTLACGGFISESWKPGHRAAVLREQLVAIRRISDP